MLGDFNVRATIAVSDLARAREFYEGTLGLMVETDNPYEVAYESGDSRISIYVSDHAGTNQATYATWEVDDAETSAKELGAVGVVFEHYDDMDGVKRKGDIHFMDGEKAAWFKDPDGNILCIHSGA
jgi:catechol 2,3-dioxygenase-like lactoylglutathione lyase family enzyme